MNKRIATLTLVVSLFAALGISAAELTGSWTASTSEERDAWLQLNVVLRPNSMNGNDFPLASFNGLTEAQIHATTITPVQFSMDRDAGRIVYEGTFRRGHGAGQFTFAPNPGYLQAMRSLGVDVPARPKRRDRHEDETLFNYAVHDVSAAFVKSMQSEGIRVPLDKYLELRIFEVTPAYIREMRELGFRDLTTQELVASRIHRVTPQYVRDMRAAGWDLSLGQLQSTAIHGATPQFAAEMKKLGYDLDLNALLSFRIHGVTAGFINELRDLGYDKLDAQTLISMRIHRVTPEFIRELRDAGYTGVPVQKLISMRIHGVDAVFLKKMR